MPDLLEHLRKFNRKERFYLIAQALGTPDFSLAPAFRDAVGKALGLTIPPDAFVAMDYHLDWIYASLYLHASDGAPGPYPNIGRLVRAHHQDIDLLVAFEAEGIHHIVLIEAKGDSAWNNEQMRRMAERFREMFGDDGSGQPGVRPHFVGLSPRPSQKLVTAEWPRWMRDGASMRWLNFDMPADLVKVTRWQLGSGHGAGKPDQYGTHWKVVSA